MCFSARCINCVPRQGNPNGLPVLLTQCEQDVESLPRLLPLGLEVLVNARKVRSDFLDLQATVVWPKFTELPKYKLKPSKLDADHAKFHTLCRFKKMTPICINGKSVVVSVIEANVSRFGRNWVPQYLVSQSSGDIG